MRFGIMAMQITELVPSNAAPEQVMVQIASFDNANLVRSLVGQGFKLIEIGGDLSLFLPHTFSPAAIERLAQLKAELGVSYTVHLPLWSVEPSTPLTPVRTGSVEAVCNILKATLPLDPEMYVLHATGALAAEFYRMGISELARGLLLRQFQGSAIDSLRAILAETGIASRKLAVETIEFPLDLTLEMAEALDLSICFDTGHVLSGFPGLVDFFDTLEKCLPRLGEVHLHDSPQLQPGEDVRYGVDHHPLGAGDLDLPRLLKRLADARWNGPVVLELSTPKAIESLAVIRRECPEYLTG